MTMTSTNCDGNHELQMPRTKYLQYTLYLTLEEMYNGTTRELAINRNIICDVCRGSGSASEIVVDYDTCEECKGLGVCTVIIRSAPDMEELIERDCELCWGKGEAVIPDDRCGNCGGRKTVPDQSILIVKVKRGTRHGQKIIYKDEGTQEPNMRPGNVVVILEALNHHTFERQGDDLFMTMYLELVESLCGFEKIVTTLDKRELSVISPQGKVVQHNQIKYFNGEGMPNYRNPNERGKLIIQFEVNLPSTIRARHITLIEKCLPPKEKIDIPIDAIESNLVDVIPDENYDDQNYSAYDANTDDYNVQDQNYDQSYDQHDQYDHDNGTHQYGSEEQYNQQNQYYQDDSYDVQGNYEHPSEYDQQYDQQYEQQYDQQYDLPYDQQYHQQVYDSHNTFQQDQFCQQDEECESLESYDATLQYRNT